MAKQFTIGNWRWRVLMICLGCGAFLIVRDARATNPPWFPGDCSSSGPCVPGATVRTCGHWLNGSMVCTCVLAETVEKAAAGTEVLALGDISVTVAGGEWTITVGNARVDIFDKRTYIRVEGNGASGPPVGLDVQGASTGFPDSIRTWKHAKVTLDEAGNWSVEAEAVLHPQPSLVRWTFNVPSSLRAAQVTEVWALDCCGSGPVVESACCTAGSGCLTLANAECGWLNGEAIPGQSCSQVPCSTSAIPTISEWGLVALTVLLAAAMAHLFRRRSTSEV